MSRTLTEIYHEAKTCRDQYLELTEFENGSKMSVLNAFTWTAAACIWSFENLVDVFQVDLQNDLKHRINGTPAYYSNALLKYQAGDELIINEAGTGFSYANVDAAKRIVTKVSYSEMEEEGFYDKQLLLKIATGEPGAYQRIEGDDLLGVRAYLSQILFAGTHAQVVSRNGDVLIPRVTVYYDGAVSESEVYENIETVLNDFIAKVSFDSAIYVQKIVDAIQTAEHVVDVHIDSTASDLQGIFVAQYDDDGHLIPTSFDTDQQPTSYETRVDRMFMPNSGYIKQSSGEKEEEALQLWRESIVLKLEV